MFRAKITAKGQLTLPKKIREKLGVKAGDYLQLKETGEGYVIEKEQDEQRFQKYAGLLKRAGGSDEIIEELRGK